MSRTIQERLADVRRLVDAARAVARDGAIVGPLVEATGLSRRGVELALAEHLETSPEEVDLVRLVERAGETERVHVVLSSNVFVGALRALAIARAAAEHVTVATSRREPVFARALVEQAADPGLSIDDGLPAESLRGGEIHVYGRDETIASFRARIAEGVRLRGHEAGLGVAIVSGRAELVATAAAIARDVVPFDQRGCLSPRLVVVLGGAAEGLCSELDRALASMEEHVPRGALDEDESSAATRYMATTTFAGRMWRGKAHLVGLSAKGASLTLPPPGRHVHVAVADGIEDARTVLAPVARLVVAIGTDAPEITVDLVGHTARISALGLMQRPPLDGPVDLRG
jgi:acyl-CoA reductase LuxC